MSKGKLILLMMTGLVVSAFAGTEVGAKRIEMEHKLEVLEWEKKVGEAKSVEERSELLKGGPDGVAYGKRMIEEVGKDFTEAWSVKYAAWLMRVHVALTMEDVKFLLGYMERFHMESGDLGQFSLSLVNAGEGDEANSAVLTAMKVRFFDGVLESKAGKRVKGETALALSILLGRMGEGLEMNERRLKLLRMAIIDAMDSKVGNTTVEVLAKEELYRLMNLTKGRLAPDLTGVDASGAAMTLSDFRGKAVMLVFWCSWEQGAEVLDFLEKSEQKHLGKDVVIVGVNRDTAANLKDLADLGKLTGRHFRDPDERLFGVYRVTQSPYCYVLDKDGKIQYGGQLGAFADLTVDAILAK